MRRWPIITTALTDPLSTEHKVPILPAGHALACRPHLRMDEVVALPELPSQLLNVFRTRLGLSDELAVLSNDPQLDEATGPPSDTGRIYAWTNLWR